MGSTKGACLVTLLCWASGAAADEAESLYVEDEAAVVRRVSATLIGEAIGGGVPLALGYALIDRSTCNVFSGCNSAPFAIGASVAPFTFAAGGTAAHALFGGRAGPGFGLAGALGGYVVGLSFLAFVSLAAGEPWSAKAPAGGAGLLTALTLAGGVLGLELRHRALLGGARPWSAARLALTTLAFWVPAAGLSIGLGFLTSYISYGSSALLWPVLLVGGFSVLFVSGLAGYGVHRSLGGRGAAGYMLPGLLASGAIAALFFFSHLWSPPTPRLFSGGGDGSAFVPIVGLTTGLAIAGPAVALEWNSALQEPVEPRRNEPQDPPVSLGITPARGGAMLGFGVRF
jgi:hypothetical protein